MTDDTHRPLEIAEDGRVSFDEPKIFGIPVSSHLITINGNMFIVDPKKTYNFVLTEQGLVPREVKG